MKALCAISVLLLVQQQQCSVNTMIQGKAAEGIREYFPDAEVMNLMPCVLSIETHVDNVSERLITEVAHKLFSSPEAQQLRLGMELGGYNYFILGFTHHTIVYDRFGGRYFVFDAQETARFFQTAPNFCATR